jgi:hypothetical protein
MPAKASAVKRVGFAAWKWFSETTQIALGYKVFDKQQWVQDFCLKFSAWAWDILRIN